MPDLAAPETSLRYADVAVTFTADQFKGIYRGGKAYHKPDIAQVIQRAKGYGCEKIMLTTMSLPLAHENLALVRQFPETCTMTLGVHPYHAKDIYTFSEALETGVSTGSGTSEERSSRSKALQPSLRSLPLAS